MTYYKGDTKRSEGCLPEKYSHNPCPNLKENTPDRYVWTDMSGETYECGVCGEYIYLDYEEMK